MGNPGKSKKRTKAALTEALRRWETTKKKEKLVQKGGHVGSFGIKDTSPIKKVSVTLNKKYRVKKRTKKEVEEPTKDVNLRDQSNEKRGMKRSRPEPEQSQDEFLFLQRQWAAVCAFHRFERDNITMTNEAADEIAKIYDIGTGGNLRRIVRRAEAEENLMRKPGSGAPRTVLEDVNFAMEEISAEFGYAFTDEVMGSKVFEKLELGRKGLSRGR